MIRSLGAVPVATAPHDQQTASASETRPTIVAMGAPVRVTLPGSTVAVVTALGPDELTPQPGNASTPGIITVQVKVEKGSVRLTSTEFTSRNETGKAVDLVTQGARSIDVTAGHTSKIVVRGTYGSGAAQLSWTHDNKLVAVWDFNIELD